MRGAYPEIKEERGCADTAPLFLSGQILAGNVFLCGGVQQNHADHQQNQQVGQHVSAVVQRGIEPGSGHGHAEEGLGHVFRPDCGAYHIMDQETGKAGAANTENAWNIYTYSEAENGNRITSNDYAVSSEEELADLLKNAETELQLPSYIPSGSG